MIHPNPENQPDNIQVNQQTAQPEPEKPKRQPAAPVHQDWWHRGIALLLALAVALPLSLLVFRSAPSEMLVDILLVSFMICIVLYLAYQGALWVIAQLAGRDDR